MQVQKSVLFLSSRPQSSPPHPSASPTQATTSSTRSCWISWARSPFSSWPSTSRPPQGTPRRSSAASPASPTSSSSASSTTRRRKMSPPPLPLLQSPRCPSGRLRRSRCHRRRSPSTGASLTPWPLLLAPLPPPSSASGQSRPCRHLVLRRRSRISRGSTTFRGLLP